jgi:hypothetical protein
MSFEDDNGNKITDSQGMCSIAKNYFLELFQPQNSNFALVIDVMHRKMSPEDNQMLTAPFTKEELCVALFLMHSSFENIIIWIRWILCSMGWIRLNFSNEFLVDCQRVNGLC